VAIDRAIARTEFLQGEVPKLTPHLPIWSQTDVAIDLAIAGQGFGGVCAAKLTTHRFFLSQADVAIDRAIARTKFLQGEVPKLAAEVEELFTTLRLAERKLYVAHQLLDEAETENARSVGRLEEARLVTGWYIQEPIE
jgi:hypothetical protein